MNEYKERNPLIKEQEKKFLLLLGYNYLKSNKLEKAVVIFKVLYHLYPDTDLFSLCLSYLYLKLNNHEDTLFYAEIYLKNKKGKLKQGRLIKSKALFALGLVDEAKECAKKIFDTK